MVYTMPLPLSMRFIGRLQAITWKKSDFKSLFLKFISPFKTAVLQRY